MAQNRINADLQTKLRFDGFLADLQKKRQKSLTQQEALNALLELGERFLKGKLMEVPD